MLRRRRDRKMTPCHIVLSHMSEVCLASTKDRFVVLPLSLSLSVCTSHNGVNITTIFRSSPATLCHRMGPAPSAL